MHFRYPVHKWKSLKPVFKRKTEFLTKKSVVVDDIIRIQIGKLVCRRAVTRNSNLIKQFLDVESLADKRYVVRGFINRDNNKYTCLHSQKNRGCRPPPGVSKLNVETELFEMLGVSISPSTSAPGTSTAAVANSVYQQTPCPCGRTLL